MSDEVTATLAAVAARLPGGGESRAGQQQMAVAVGRAIEDRRHLVVQAGTGTGKSLAYLIPAALSGERVVVATATKALQDQLAHNDLPLVSEAIDRRLSYAVLKGRSNYVCRQRVAEIGGRGEQLTLQPGSADPPDADDPLTPAADGADAPPDDPSEVGRLGDQVRRLVRWADDTTTGDRAELEFEPHFRAWAMVSTTARECPGAFRCPSGHECFAEAARARAAEADVVVVNTHLYGAHLASGGAVLPPHQVVVFDEAHDGGGGDDRQPGRGDRARALPGPGRHRPPAAGHRRVGGPRHPGRGRRGGRSAAAGAAAAGRTGHPPRLPARRRRYPGPRRAEPSATPIGASPWASRSASSPPDRPAPGPAHRR